jgi:hypothetical protein
VRNPPILISVLGFFAIMAGFVWIVVGLRALGVDFGTALGDLPKFENIGIWGIVSLLVGVLWIVAGIGLWALQPWAWMVAAIVAVIAIVDAFFLAFSYAGTGAALAQVILPLVILWYLNTAEVKESFGLPTGRQG